LAGIQPYRNSAYRDETDLLELVAVHHKTPPAITSATQHLHPSITRVTIALPRPSLRPSETMSVA
jgi:hypothetical protein